MANYCILRIAKIKTDGNVGASLQHQYRNRETPNADIDKADLNQNSNKSVEQAMARYREILPEKVRKNAVKAVEVLITASPEALEKMNFKEQEKYFQDSLNFISDRYGTENVFHFSFHQDEKTPHLHVMFVPKIDGKLNCKKLFGTDNAPPKKDKNPSQTRLTGRQKLRNLQDDFYAEVGQKHSLERGIKNSRATHKDISKFYGELKELDEQVLTPPKKELFESAEKYQERFQDQLKDLPPHYKTALEGNYKAAAEKAVADSLVSQKKFDDLQKDFDLKVSEGYYSKIAEAREAEKNEFEKQKIKDFEEKDKEICDLKSKNLELQKQNSELQQEVENKVFANNQHMKTIFNQNKIVEDLKAEKSNETKRAEKAEKHVSDIERRIDKTLQALGGNAQEIFDKKYYEIKDLEERPKNRSSGFERS